MTPGQLVKAMSIALNVPEETVVQHDRNLAVAGLRTMGARGRNAPHVTPLDAARLLVAVLGSVRVRDSVEVVRAFEVTTYVPPSSLADLVGDDWPEAVARSMTAEMKEYEPVPSRDKFLEPAIERLPQSHNFVEAVAALISDASGPIDDLDKYLQRFSQLNIECDLGHFPLGLKISHLGTRGPGPKYEQPPKVRAKKPESKEPKPPRHWLYAGFYGIFQTRRIHGAAIMLLGKAFRDGHLDFDTTPKALNALLGVKKPKSGREGVA